jgi:hypothetical protein
MNDRVTSGTEETRTVDKVVDNTEGIHNLEAVGYVPAAVLRCALGDVGG